MSLTTRMCEALDKHQICIVLRHIEVFNPANTDMILYLFEVVFMGLMYCIFLLE